MNQERYICGVDVGGTFTDVVLIDLAHASIAAVKVPTTADHPSDAILQGMAILQGKLQKSEGTRPSLRLVHATTLITNALIERRGARVGLLTTAGFSDVLDMRRENRFDIFDLKIRFPKAIVPRADRWEIDERMSSEGETVVAVERTAVERVAGEMRARGIESVAIAFINSYVTPEHERQAAAVLREAGGFEYISLSGETAPIIREYERTSTVVVNAYTMPLVDRYLATLNQDINRLWPDTRLSLMVSNGGICSPDAARAYPVRLLESGPVAGALVAGYFGQRAGARHVLAVDMGGTTAKLCVVRDGVPNMVNQFEADRVARFRAGSGIPILSPCVDLVEIGAGGGSIASVDELGLLQVGPRSAGARPGPACYGHGGSEPTVTDADLLLGYLNPEYFVGGNMALDVSAATVAFETHVGQPLGISALQAAWGVHDVVNENMSSAAWLHMAEKGLDPRVFTLVATGGAGPLHACHLAVKLGISTILFPPMPGLASAFGLLIAPPRVDIAQTFFSALDDLDFAALNALLGDLEQQSAQVLTQAGIAGTGIVFKRVGEMLYAGQTHQIDIELPEHDIDAAALPGIIEAFQKVYLNVYGGVLEDTVIEIVGLRVSALAAAPDIPDRIMARSDSAARPPGRRKIYLAAAAAMQDVDVIDRRSLMVGQSREGPAIIESDDTTIVVEPEWNIAVDASGVLTLTKNGVHHA